ncbi:glyoxylase-like metal-dependent hydrolase (beta-lactamase superfamily II) [Anaerobacterium chartisolvens]|uniref:Glyoxylase-like metal-dependent hydrolase (Beta-lactamase superfamily II) n=1 Tax=Anaerobacterium chartisolvens TaxID=1297424 RepID=A0A369B081_9FIRM|nr:MBL fold metallo-hydrolase [Anaerobacterium chartisolvens]RCX14811.1 glyoxylase-like metal-dependent hydrolase (beta-lactamase superfamily II) [Anaerobacterium chartisolvens]
MEGRYQIHNTYKMHETYEIYQVKASFLNIINYVYIIADRCGGNAAVVDPAWDLNGITERLENMDVELKSVLLTHSHYDHVNMVEPLLRRFNPRVYMSRKEIDFYGFRCKNLNALENYQVIDIGNIHVSCIHTPGHTAGGMCYLLPRHIFTGDTVFIEGCGACSFYGGSPEDMFESIQRLKVMLSHDICVYPGHSYGMEPGCTFGQLLEKNIYFQFSQKDHFVNFRMRKRQRHLFSFK